MIKHVRNNSALVRAVDRVKPSTKTGMQKSEAAVCSPRKLRVGTWNVESMKGRASEVVEAITRRKTDICCLTETRWKGKGTKWINGRNSRAKFFWQGAEDGYGGVGILIQEIWSDKIIEVKRISSRIMYVKLCIDKCTVTILCLYAPQASLPEPTKVLFYDNLQSVMSSFGSEEIVFACGDWNGHIGEKAPMFDKVHGNLAFGETNKDGERILEFADANELAICNSFFRKKSSNHLVTYCSGGNSTQVDYILVKQRDRKLVSNTKVIPGEECVPKHRLLVCDTSIDVPKLPKPVHTPKLRVWKLKEPACRKRFLDCINSSSLIDHDQDTISVDQAWDRFRDTILSAVETACGWTKQRRSGARETWWWNDTVDKAVSEKRVKWKAWMKGGSKASYNAAKKVAKRVVYTALGNADHDKFLRAENNKDEIFKMAKKMKAENSDVVGDKCVRDNSGKISYTDEAKLAAWKEHHEQLLNVEFPWDPDSLSPAPPVEGPATYFSANMVGEARKKQKKNKAPGMSGLCAEMIEPVGEVADEYLAKLFNKIVSEGKVPNDWSESIIVNLFKGKGDALERGNYRGLKLLDQGMKMFERILEKIIREQVNINEMQYGFMPGRGTTDAIFILRQLQERDLHKNKRLYFVFVDLEKAFDRVPRKVLWWAMRKLGVEEWIIGLVQALYNGANCRVRVNGKLGQPFDVKVGLHQGSVLSPLLFIIVLEALSKEFRTGCPWELLYADDLVIVSHSLADLQQRFDAWKSGMEAKGLRVNVGKTKFMTSGPDLNPLYKSGKNPCGVCLKGVGSNSIFCEGCKQWVHWTKCSEQPGKRAKAVPGFRCSRCLGTARSIHVQTDERIYANGEPLESVDTFCYLGDTISAGGGCESAAITRARTAWGKYRDLQPILSSKNVALRTKGRVYDTCIRSAMLYGSETWAPRKTEVDRLQRNERSMLRSMCGIRPDERVGSAAVCEKLGISELDNAIAKRRLRWFGHVERSSGWINQCQKVVVEGPARRGRYHSWNGTVDTECRKRHIKKSDALDRVIWRKRVSSLTVHTPN